MGSHFLEYMIISALFLLLPLIPAILIYKTFPKDRISIKGVLHAFTINASGGFAAYLICCIFLYFFVLQGYIQYLKDENFVSNDQPSFISSQVLLNNSWSAEYVSLDKREPEYAWRSKIRFVLDSSNYIVLTGITYRRDSKGEDVPIIEWKSEPFTMSYFTKNFEIRTNRRWLDGEIQFDPSIAWEVKQNKWEKGNLSFKSDYLFRGSFKPDEHPSTESGLWLNRPPQ